MEREFLRSFLLAEAAKPFSGWDFSYLDARISTAPLTWSYPSIVLQRLHGGRPPASLLDMGTGGGEFFSRLGPFPPNTWATESFPPNIPLAQRRLEPLGVRVVAFERDAALPLPDQAFELVINRHESYDLQELFRIMVPGGTFVTQQVGGLNDAELVRMLGARPDPQDTPWDAEFAAAELRQAGFEVLQTAEHLPVTRIFDVGAIAYYFKAIPWEIPDFSVDGYLDALLRVHDRIQVQGFVDVRSHRFLVIAQKPV